MKRRPPPSPSPRLDALSFVLSALHPRLPVAFYCQRTEVRRKKTYDHGRIPNNVTGGTHSRGTPPRAEESNSSGSIQESNRAGIEIAIRRRAPACIVTRFTIFSQIHPRDHFRRDQWSFDCPQCQRARDALRNDYVAIIPLWCMWNFRTNVGQILCEHINLGM